MGGRLSVFRIVAGSFEYPWRHRAAFARATAVPALTMIACTLVGDVAARSGSAALAWLVYGAYIAVCCWIAVVCHRLVLMSPADGNAFAGSGGSTRLVLFLAAVICIAAVYFAVFLGIANLLAITIGWRYTPAGTPPRESAYFFGGLLWVSQITALYVSARLALTLPAIATDQGFSFRQAWIHSRRNGWRLALVVFGLPWLLARLAELLARDGATPVETAVLLVLGVVLLIIEVVALSLSFYDLTALPPAHPPG